MWYIYSCFPLKVNTSQQATLVPTHPLTNSTDTRVPHWHHFQHPAQHPHMLPTKACRFTSRSTVSSVAHNMRDHNRMKNNPTYHSLKLNMPTVLQNWFAFSPSTSIANTSTVRHILAIVILATRVPCKTNKSSHFHMRHAHNPSRQHTPIASFPIGLLKTNTHVTSSSNTSAPTL